MEIQKDSWHYRLIDWLDLTLPPDKPMSLCSYFWRVVGGVFLLAVFVLLAGPLSLLLACTIAPALIFGLLFYLGAILQLVGFPALFHGVVWPFTVGSDMGVWIRYQKVMVSAGATLWVLAFVVLAVVYIRSRWTKSQNLLVEFFRAKIKKVCPLIEFKEK